MIVVDMLTKNLFEAATLVESPTEGLWKVRLISEGKGSSGIYPPELLETYYRAFNESLSFENHPTGWDGPQSRNFTQIVGKVVGETWTERDERGKLGVYANWDPDPQHRERLARYKSNLGLSIYIEGDGHLDEDGEFVVDSFNEHDPWKSVDVVIAAGRGGRFEESLAQIYSQRRENQTSSLPRVDEGKESKMDEKVLEAIEALNTRIDTLVSAQNAKAEEAAVKDTQAQTVEQAVEAFDAARKAVEDADLFPEQVEDLLAEAKKGVDITSMIEKAKAVKEAAVKHVTENAEVTTNGRIMETNTSTTYGAWSN